MSSLKEKYELETPPTPLQIFKDNPCPRTLSMLSKELQTTEMIEEVSANCEANFNLLKYVSKRALTYDICKRECSKRGTNLRYVPKRFMDIEMCQTAVVQDGTALAFVPDDFRSFELCMTAVQNDKSRNSWNLALKYVPGPLLSGSDGRRLCNAAVKVNSLALNAVPTKYKSRAMVIDAIKNSWPGEYRINRWESPDSAPTWHHATSWPIEFVPKGIMDESLVKLSVELFPFSLAGIPRYAVKYLDDELCINAIKKDWRCVSRIPEPVCGHKAVVECALAESPRALGSIPDRMRTKLRCFTAKEADHDGVLLHWFPDKIREQWEELHPEDREYPEVETETEPKPEPIEIVSQPTTLPLPSALPNNVLSVKDTGKLLAHELECDLKQPMAVYYVSDLHIDHQISFASCENADQAAALIAPKVEELVSSLPEKDGYILIAGDVADNQPLVKLFYKSLKESLSHSVRKYRTVAVIGNHELWNDWSVGLRKNRSADAIVSEYKEMFAEALPSSFSLLENELYVLYKGTQSRIISEKDLLACDAIELSEICEESPILILGGLGYSGKNPQYNASMGLYRDVVSLEEDVIRSDRFQAVYDKVLKCAEKQKVIVLTHSPIQNWLTGAPNPNWTYINGHTHNNGFVKDPNGATILFDNQVGYKPNAWHFNMFETESSYDIFADLKDGIYEISSSQYNEFNQTRGIESQFNRSGIPYVVKHDGMYMFFAKRKDKLFMLEGGRIHKAEHSMEWYFERMPEYVARVRAAFAPYRNTLLKIAEEVRSFGGYGSIHGCIVDIDFFNHIYVNPFDGTITPYFAWDMTNKEMHRTMEGLLGSRDAFFTLPIDEDDYGLVLQRFHKAVDAGKITLLSKQNIGGKHTELASVPEIVLDRTMYEPSRLMRSIQYVFDNDVIRIWRDSVLESETKEESPALHQQNGPGGNKAPRKLTS